MKYASIQVLPDVPAGGVFAGIDWATADHVACVVDMAGRILDRFSAAHDKAGIEMLITRLRENQATEVAIERGGGVLVEATLGGRSARWPPMSCSSAAQLGRPCSRARVACASCRDGTRPRPGGASPPASGTAGSAGPAADAAHPAWQPFPHARVRYTGQERPAVTLPSKPVSLQPCPWA